jgi:potassium-transporting ATPase KdpC subunit
MFRRMLLTSVLLTVVGALVLGIGYPLVVTGVGKVFFSDRADGSIIKRNGVAIGSSLIGQNFLDNKGNPDKKFFQSRPSAAGTGYDALSSAASNLGPGDPRLVGYIPGFNSVDLQGNPSKTNPFATKDDPYCVPVQATDKAGNPKVDKKGNPVYEKNDDGSYVCNSSTVPERVLAYRELNGLPKSVKVPVDAVTASASGLDPDISKANALLQVPRIAKARGLSEAQVTKLVDEHTNSRQLGILGEKTVNVLDLNLALNGLRG